MKSSLTSMEGRTRSSVIMSSFKVNECGRCKLESEHNSGANYLSLTKLMVNDSFHLSLCTNPSSTSKISTSTLHCTGNYITHHMVIWIETGCLKPRPNSTTYVVTTLSTIKYYVSMNTAATLMTAHPYIWSAKTSNPSS